MNLITMPSRVNSKKVTRNLSLMDDEVEPNNTAEVHVKAENDNDSIISDESLRNANVTDSEVK